MTKHLGIALGIILLFAPFAEAQIVRLESAWTKCGTNGCTILRDYATGTVVGKTKDGRSLVLGCRHSTVPPQGAKLVSLQIGGRNASVLKASATDDLALFVVEGDLGRALPISTSDAKIGEELEIAGYDKSSPRISRRRGKLKAKDILDGVSPELGNSGGPVVKRDVVYGIVYGRPAPIQQTGWSVGVHQTYFVPATRVVSFVQQPRPVFGINFFNPLGLLGIGCETARARSSGVTIINQPAVGIDPCPPEAVYAVPRSRPVYAVDPCPQQPVYVVPRVRPRYIYPSPTYRTLPLYGAPTAPGAVYQVPPANVHVIPPPDTTIQVPPPSIRLQPRAAGLYESDLFTAFPVDGDGDLATRLNNLETRVTVIDDRVTAIELQGSPGNPGTPPTNDLTGRVSDLEVRVQNIDDRVRALESSSPPLGARKQIQTSNRK